MQNCNYLYTSLITILILVVPLSFCLQSFPSIRVFPNESALCIRWPKDWSFSFNISPSNEYSGLISFRIDWFDLAVQGTLKSLLQYHNLKASVLQHSGFFMGQLSHLYDYWKNIALAITDLCRQSGVAFFFFNRLSSLLAIWALVSLPL